MRLLALSLLVVGCVLAAAVDNTPMNVKLAYGGADSMLVTWKTTTAVNDSHVLFGDSESSSSRVDASVFTLYAPDGYYCRAKIGPLKPNTRYNYQVGSATQGLSPVMSFSSHKTNKDTVRALVVGDMGLYNSNDTVMSMRRLVDAQAVDVVLHLGDLGYADDWFLRDLIDKLSPNAARGTSYLDSWHIWEKWMAPITSALPYMSLPGNHEASCEEILPTLCPKHEQNFIPYRSKFYMPFAESGAINSMWWSQDIGPFHYVAVDSETDFPDAAEGAHSRFGNNTFGDQLAWLEADLAKAFANRAEVPVIIVGMHRPLYTGNSPPESGSCMECKKAFEGLFLKYGVDMVLAGHVHDYQRMWPMREGIAIKTFNKPGAPVYIVNGAGGGVEGHTKTCANNYGIQVVCDDEHFGYALMDVSPDGSIKWSYHIGGSDVVTDSFTLTL